MWLKEHKMAVAIIVVLIMFSILVAMSFRGDSGSSGVKSNLQNVVNLVAKPLDSAANGLRGGFSSLFEFRKNAKENQKLTAEIDRLKKDNADLELRKQEHQELKELSKVFQYEALENKNLLAANVISVDHSTWMRIFTIDRGSADGVKNGDAILVGDGLVGKVIELSKNSSKIMSLLDDQNKISFQIKRDNKVMGVVQGDGKSGLSGYVMDGDSEAKKGDLLVTSGIGNYPKGIKIGKITKLQKNKGTQFINLEGELSVPLHKLRKVAVLL